MFLGHFGLALAAKRAAPRASLGTTVFAAQFLDLLWPLLLLAGVERVRIVPGLMEASALDFEHYPVTHSLLMAAVWALLVAGIYYAVRRYRTGALVVGGLVLSHWLLDAPMHRPDLPLWPGSDVLVGGGLWHSLTATLFIEAGLLAAGAFVYTRTTRPLNRRGSWGLWAMIALLVVFFAGALFGPPPPDARTIAFSALALWLFVPWAAWIDRNRALVRTQHDQPAHGELARTGSIG
jgi:membrane-bound metal-dependent hydrolase YbcI (DUF457 family)